jgi:hypothetical protein
VQGGLGGRVRIGLHTGHGLSVDRSDLGNQLWTGAVKARADIDDSAHTVLLRAGLQERQQLLREREHPLHVERE